MTAWLTPERPACVRGEVPEPLRRAGDHVTAGAGEPGVRDSEDKLGIAGGVFHKFLS